MCVICSSMGGLCRLWSEDTRKKAFLHQCRVWSPLSLPSPNPYSHSMYREWHWGVRSGLWALTTENTDLEPVNWNKVAWEPDVAGSRTNPGRQAPPAGPPGRSPPSALPPPTASRALQVTQLHSHSDATTLAAIIAHWSSFLNRYDSDLRARTRAMTSVLCLTAAESRLPSLSFS